MKFMLVKPTRVLTEPVKILTIKLAKSEYKLLGCGSFSKTSYVLS